MNARSDHRKVRPSRPSRTRPPPASTGTAALPGEIGFLAEMRRLERAAGDKPRFGRNERLRDEIAELGQDPFTAFPDRDLGDPAPSRRGLPSLRVRFLGLFGPHGALPLATTEEVERWVARGDRAFVQFVDILVARFIQLYFRAWSEGEPVAQFDRPDDDRFQDALRALIGAMTPAFRGRDGIDDTARLAAVSLACGRVRSSTRLRQILSLFLPAEIEVEEMIPTWLVFEPDDRSFLGRSGCGLGAGLRLGARTRSLAERIRLHVRVRSIEAYRDFLPGGSSHERMRDLVAWYLGRTIEVDVALWLPADAVPMSRLGTSGELGWLALLGRLPPSGSDGLVHATTFHLSLDPLPASSGPLKPGRDPWQRSASKPMPAS